MKKIMLLLSKVTCIMAMALAVTCVFITAFAVVNVMASEDFTAYQPDVPESLEHD